MCYPLTHPFLFVGVQPCTTTLFGVPVPLPSTQEYRAQQLKTRPVCWIPGLHEASTQGTNATSANLFRNDCLGMQRSPKAVLFRPINVDIPECDCHLPTMVSNGKRTRPVVTPVLARKVAALSFPAFLPYHLPASLLLHSTHCQPLTAILLPPRLPPLTRQGGFGPTTSAS